MPKRKRQARELQELVARDGGVCWLCGLLTEARGPDLAYRPSRDHVVPLGAGGEDWLGNLRLAHAWCNNQRGMLAEGELELPFPAPPRGQVLGQWKRNSGMPMASVRTPTLRALLEGKR